MAQISRSFWRIKASNPSVDCGKRFTISIGLRTRAFDFGALRLRVKTIGYRYLTPVFTQRPGGAKKKQTPACSSGNRRFAHNINLI